MGRVLYTEEQRTVVTAPLNIDLVIEAGPGSGKSRTTAGRVAWLLLMENVPASGVAAITFTENAAATLQERVAQILDEKANEQVLGLADLTVTTIHAFLLHLLRRHIPRYRKFRLFGPAERDLLLCHLHASEKVNLRCVARLDTAVTNRNTKKASDKAPEPFFTNAFEDRRCFLLAADVTREECVNDGDLPDGFRQVYAAYRTTLEERRVWDYSELLVTALGALNDTQDEEGLVLQEYLRQNLRYVLVDEYNDVNPVLVRILRRLGDLGVSIVAIGDADQTCFRFRGSKPDADLPLFWWTVS